MHEAVTVFNDSLQLLYRMSDLSFKLGRYTVSNSVRSDEYGWWISLWNPNTSHSSFVFLAVNYDGRVVPVQNYIFNMSSLVWTLLQQRMREIAVNRLEQNNIQFP